MIDESVLIDESFQIDERFLNCLYLKWASFFKSASFSFMNLDSPLLHSQEQKFFGQS